MTTSRRSILAGLAALSLARRSGAPSLTDPTFALIEQHRVALAALNAVEGDITGGEPEDVAEQAAMTALVEREPDTLAGLRAFANYLDAHAQTTGDYQVPGWALATIAEACRRLIPAPMIGGGA